MTPAYSRRGLALLPITGLASPRGGGSGGVRVGVQASCFHGLLHASDGDAVDTLIRAMANCDLRDCELSPAFVEPAAFAGHASGHHGRMPPQMMRRELRKWRLRTPLSYFESIGTRLQKAGVQAYAYNYRPDATFSDEEIDRGFSMARALGAEIVTASAEPELAGRMAPFAEKHGMAVAIGSLREMTVSSAFKLHLDIGELVAGGVDPVAYVREHHAQIASVYWSDSTDGKGAATRDVLQLLKREASTIRVCLKCEHGGAGTGIEEVKRCLASVRQALA